MRAYGRVRPGGFTTLASVFIAASAIACSLCVGVSQAPAAPSTASVVSAARSCGTIHASGYAFRVTIIKGHTSCRIARKVLRAFMSGKGTKHGSGPEANLTWRVYRWTCGHGTGGGGCTRRGARILAQMV